MIWLLSVFAVIVGFWAISVELRLETIKENFDILNKERIGNEKTTD